MKKNVAGQTVGAQLVSATDGSAVTTGTTTVYGTGDGGTQSAFGTATHEGQGYWSFAPSQAETNFDHIGFTFTNPAAISATVQTFTTFPQTQDHTTAISNVDAAVDAILIDTGTTIPAQIAALNDFDPSTDTVALVTTVSNMRGTDNAMLAASYTAPDNASIGSILTDTSTTIPAQISGLNDISSADVNAACDTALADYDAPTITEMDAAFTEIKGAGFTSTDTLEAIRDRGDAAWTTGAGGTAPTVEDIRIEMDNNSIQLAAIVADTNELQLNQGNWLTATGFSTFNPSSDTVANVTLVGTVTTNTDMRGTDGANTIAPDNAGISSTLSAAKLAAALSA